MEGENLRLSNQIVHRFVHKTPRDGLRRGTYTKLDASGRRLSAEVSTPTRDGPRRQRRTS
jgi:hypothetical protein